MFGLGLRSCHYDHVLNHSPNVDFFEIHTENFITPKGTFLFEFLHKISHKYPISFHCIGLSIGSVGGINRKHLDNIKKLAKEFNPFIISDHLSWSNSQNGTANDLLPLPYNQESLRVFCDNLKLVQDTLGCKILIENPSAYVEFKSSTMTEVDFLNEMSHITGCGLLLDINNVFVNCQNFYHDAKRYLDEIDVSKVSQIHLAGHETYLLDGKPFRIDTHNRKVSHEVLELYNYFLDRTIEDIPTMIEWDEDIPAFSVLEHELERVKNVYYDNKQITEIAE